MFNGEFTKAKLKQSINDLRMMKLKSTDPKEQVQLHQAIVMLVSYSLVLANKVPNVEVTVTDDTCRVEPVVEGCYATVGRYNFKKR